LQPVVTAVKPTNRQVRVRVVLRVMVNDLESSSR
jgi:hypothetical protein